MTHAAPIMAAAEQDIPASTQREDEEEDRCSPNGQEEYAAAAAPNEYEEGEHMVYTKDVQDLRGKLDSFLRSKGLYSKVREILKERNIKGEPNSLTHIRRALREAGVISDVVNELHSTHEADSSLEPAIQNIQTTTSSRQFPNKGKERTRVTSAGSWKNDEQETENNECAPAGEDSEGLFYDLMDDFQHGDSRTLQETAKLRHMQPLLKLHFLSGAAFTDNVEDNQKPHNNNFKSYYVVHLLFRDQRFRSPMIPVETEPDFNCVFTLRLPPFPTDKRSNRDLLQSLMASSELIYCSLVQVSTYPSNGNASYPDFESKLVSSWTIEWRDVLVTGKRAIRVELPQIGDASAMTDLPVGILDVRLNFLVKNEISGATKFMSQLVIPDDPSKITPEQVDEKLRSEKQHRDRIGQKLASQARKWYGELKYFVPSTRRSMYKITRRTMLGENRPVTSFVKPLRPGHLLLSLQHAARFVSLFPSEAQGSDEDYDFCRNHFEAVAIKRLNPFERACFLCSLFRGFCIWAFVAIGSRKRGSNDTEERHSWVVTLSRDEHAEIRSYCFWEPTTGENCQQGQYTSTDGYVFENVYLLFNDRELYANVNENPHIRRCEWDVETSRCWKSLDPRYFIDFPVLPYAPLVPPSIKDYVLSSKLENELKARIKLRRDKQSMTTTFNSELSYILSMSLNAYENERLNQQAPGAEFFQEAVNNFTPRGYSFKAFPIMFNHSSPGRIFATLKQSDFARSIIECAEPDTTLAVRCQANIFPEDVLALWLIVATVHREVPEAT